MLTPGSCVLIDLTSPYLFAHSQRIELVGIKMPAPPLYARGRPAPPLRRRAARAQRTGEAGSRFPPIG
jgi:hypothetical protein